MYVCFCVPLCVCVCFCVLYFIGASLSKPHIDGDVRPTSRGMFVCIWPRGAFVLPMFPREKRPHTHDVIGMWRTRLSISILKLCLKPLYKTAQQQSLQTSGQHLDQLVQDKSTSRKRQRAAESPDQRERQLERQREYQREYRRQKAAEQTPGKSAGERDVCNSGGKRHTKRVTSATEKRTTKLQKKRVYECESRSVESVEHWDTRLENMRLHAQQTRAVESVEHKESRLENMRLHAQQDRAVEGEEQRSLRLQYVREHTRASRSEVITDNFIGQPFKPFYTQSALKSIH